MEVKPLVVVTGASGQLGNAIVAELIERHRTGGIVAATREPDGPAALAASPATIRHCDFAEPGTLDAAFEGADAVLIVSVNKIGEEASSLHRNAIAACVRAGVARIFYTSHMGARVGSAFAPADQHFVTEGDLAQAGLAFTALRHGFYAESCLQVIGDGLKSGDLRVPEDGPVSWTARADLAEADAALLAGKRRFDGPTPPLTAAEAITMADVAALAGEVTGRSIRHTIVSDDEWVAARVAAGTPEVYARLLLGMFEAARSGDFAATDPLLGNLLGRAPRSMRDILRDSFAAAGD